MSSHVTLWRSFYSGQMPRSRFLASWFKTPLPGGASRTRWRRTSWPVRWAAALCGCGLGAAALHLDTVDAALPARPCLATSRIMDSLIARPASARRICSGTTYAAYKREVARYQSLGVHFEIWSTAVKDAPGFDTYLRTHLHNQAYQLKQRFTNGEAKYQHPAGKGVRVSSWKQGGAQYWMLFIY